MAEIFYHAVTSVYKLFPLNQTESSGTGPGFLKRGVQTYFSGVRFHSFNNIYSNFPTKMKYFSRRGGFVRTPRTPSKSATDHYDYDHYDLLYLQISA